MRKISRVSMVVMTAKPAELYDALAPIPFSCRSASCATCHVEVLAGGELMEPPEEAEQDLLDIVGGPPGSRLACQVIVKPGPGLIKIRSLDGG